MSCILSAFNIKFITSTEKFNKENKKLSTALLIVEQNSFGILIISLKTNLKQLVSEARETNNDLCINPPALESDGGAI